MESSPQPQNPLKRLLRVLVFPLCRFGAKIAEEIHAFEMFYFRLQNIYAFTSQMFFFILSAVIFDQYHDSVSSNERFILMALKTLLFYSVFTYFVAKTKQICTSNTHASLSIFNNFTAVEGFCKIVIEWAKALVVVFCLREQGISFQPSFSYATITAVYYLSTDKIYLDLAQILLQKLECQFLENLEHLYVPLVFNTFSTFLSIIMEIVVLKSPENLSLFFMCLYFNVYLRLKDSYYNYWKFIEVEKHTYESFRTATARQLEEYDDICAVCLNKMSKAKITPCNHYFHPACLKECIKTSLMCPICKYNFL